MRTRLYTLAFTHTYARTMHINTKTQYIALVTQPKLLYTQCRNSRTRIRIHGWYIRARANSPDEKKKKNTNQMCCLTRALSETEQHAWPRFHVWLICDFHFARATMLRQAASIYRCWRVLYLVGKTHNSQTTNTHHTHAHARAHLGGAHFMLCLVVGRAKICAIYVCRRLLRWGGGWWWAMETRHWRWWWWWWWTGSGRLSWWRQHVVANVCGAGAANAACKVSIVFGAGMSRNGDGYNVMQKHITRSSFRSSSVIQSGAAFTFTSICICVNHAAMRMRSHFRRRLKRRRALARFGI